MKRLFAFTIAAALLTAVVPHTSAETMEQQYLTSSGAWVQPLDDNGAPGGNAVTVCPDAYAWPLDPDWDPVDDPFGSETGPRGCTNPDPIIPHIGSANFYPNSAWGNAQVTPSDDVTGSNAPIAACLWDPDNPGNRCVTDGHAASDFACGSAVVSADGRFLAEWSTVFVFTVLVESDFGVCAGTTGTIVVDFF